MAILHVEERYQEQEGADTINGTTYTRSFYVETNLPTDGPRLIKSARGIPTIGDGYPGDSGIKLTERRAKPIDNERLYWVVTCLYGNQGTDGNQINNIDSESPEFLKPVVSFQTQKYIFNSRSAYRFSYQPSTDSISIPAGEARGAPTEAVINSAKEYYSTGIEVVKTNLIINVSRNEIKFDSQVVTDFVDTINQNTIIIGGVTIYGGQGALRDLTATPRWDSAGKRFWSVSYQIEIDRTSHVVRMPDYGFNERDEEGLLKPIKNSEGENVTEPVPLDGLGKEANPDAPGFEQAENIFWPYWALDWGLLNLPKKA